MFFFSLSLSFAVRLTVSQIFTSLWGILYAQPADFILGAVLSFPIHSGKQKLYSLTFWLFFVKGGRQTSISPSHRVVLIITFDLAHSHSGSGRIKVQLTFEHAATSWEKTQHGWSSQGPRPVFLPPTSLPQRPLEGNYLGCDLLIYPATAAPPFSSFSKEVGWNATTAPTPPGGNDAEGFREFQIPL